MRRLGALSGLVLFACHAASSPNLPQEEPKPTPTPTSTPSTSTSTKATSNAASPPEQPETKPLENALWPGTVVRIQAIEEADPLFQDVNSLVGLLCASDGRLALNPDGYASGSASCGPTQSLMRFTRVKVELIHQPQETPPDPKPAARFSGPSVRVGQAFIIHALDGRDAYFSRAKELIGRACVVTKELKSQGDGWFSGTAKCSPPVEYMYFSRVAVELR